MRTLSELKLCRPQLALESAWKTKKFIVFHLHFIPLYPTCHPLFHKAPFLSPSKSDFSRKLGVDYRHIGGTVELKTVIQKIIFFRFNLDGGPLAGAFMKNFLVVVIIL